MSLSAFHRPSTSQGWEVIPGEGTNIVYEWQVTLLRDHSVTREGRLAGDHTKVRHFALVVSLPCIEVYIYIGHECYSS